jgi:NADP-dependent 3-hydroxy acid dehydrogenase YdfG
VNLQNKVAVVTGASSGIGLETVRTLIRQDVTVFGLSRSVMKMAWIKSQFDPTGKRFFPIEADLTNEQSVKQAFVKIFTQTPRIDILINNAGLGIFGDVEKFSTEDWQTVLSTNLTGVFFCTREVVPKMKAASSGHIINVSSIAGKVGFKGGSAYNASKFGLAGFSEAIMQELRDFGIKVTCLFPGSTATNFFNRGIVSTENKMSPEAVAEIIITVLKQPDNLLIDQIVMRPLNRK